jgi:hypothetical protein
VLPQHVSPNPQEVRPQQVSNTLAQKFGAPLLQHFWPKLQARVPQHVWPNCAQNALEPEPQQAWKGKHAVFPQHDCPGGAQNGGLEPPVQQTLPPVHLGEHVAASACFTPSEPRSPPANAPPKRRNAFLRGTELARMRATSSTR